MKPPSLLPVPGSTLSFWRSAPQALENHRSTTELPAQVDVAIIGAGYAGVSTVHHILSICKQRGVPPPSIVILEARQACSGATGRNGGHLKPDPYNRIAGLATTHGIDTATECAAFESANLSAVKRLIEEERIDCDFVLTRAVDVLMTEALSGIKGAKGSVSYTAAHLSPYKLILHLLSEAVDAGVNLQTHTPVTSVQGSTLVTPRGAITAKQIVYAANGYTPSVLPEFSSKIVPSRGICCHIKPSKTPSPFMRNSYIIRWSAAEYEYLIPRLDGSIVVGGARSHFYHDLQSWYNNVNDGCLIESAKTYFDGYMQRLFPSWNDSGAYTSQVWTGIMGYSSDGMPHIGTVPGRENQFILAGFSGHGMPQVYLAAKCIAATVMREGSPFRDCGVPLVYQTSQGRLNNPRNHILEAWRDHKDTRRSRL